MEQQLNDFFELKDVKIETLEKESAIIHYISTPDVDRGRDIVNPKGIDYKDFERTKTVFYNHNYSMPIGSNQWLKATSDGIKAKTVFGSLPYQRDIYQMHKEDVIRTWSIGFDIPRKSGRFSDFIDGAVSYDDDNGKRKINKWTLLEYSSAPLAMNPNAIDLAKAKEICKSFEIKNLIENVDVSFDMKNLIEGFRSELQEVKELISKGNEPEQSNTDIEEIKKEVSEIKTKLG